MGNPPSNPRTSPRSHHRWPRSNLSHKTKSRDHISLISRLPLTWSHCRRPARPRGNDCSTKARRRNSAPCKRSRGHRSQLGTGAGGVPPHSRERRPVRTECQAHLPLAAASQLPGRWAQPSRILPQLGRGGAGHSRQETGDPAGVTRRTGPIHHECPPLARRGSVPAQESTTSPHQSGKAPLEHGRKSATASTEASEQISLAIPSSREGAADNPAEMSNA